jgi:hypothetical protein
MRGFGMVILRREVYLSTQSLRDRCFSFPTIPTLRTFPTPAIA